MGLDVIGRWLLGAAFALGLALPAPAHAQGTAKQASGGASCTFGGFVFDPATNTMSVQCTSTTVTTCTSTASGAFSFATASSGPIASGNAGTVQVTRTGASDCAYSLTWSVAAPAGTTVTVNGSSAATGLLVFADKDTTAKTLSVVATTSAAADVVITLSGTVPGGITPNATHTMRFNPSGIEGCSTPAPDKTGTFTVANQKIVFQLKPGEVGAVAFTPSLTGGVIVLSTTDTIMTPPEADHEVTISRCPNDFGDAIGPFCRYSANFVGSSRWVNTGNVTPLAFYHCAVEAGKTYYMNVRQVKLGTTTHSCANPPSSTNGGCEVRLQNTGL